MPFVSYDSELGQVDLSVLDSVGPGVYSPNGTGAGRFNFYMQENPAYDTNLGGGVFVFAAYSGTITAGTIVEFTPSLTNGRTILQATAWAGTANTGKPLGVCYVSGAVGNFGWFQVQGCAIVNTTTNPTAGSSVYWSSTGAVGGTAAAGKQVLNSQYVTTSGVAIGQGTSAQTLTTTQAVILLNRPCAQGAIT